MFNTAVVKKFAYTIGSIALALALVFNLFAPFSGMINRPVLAAGGNGTEGDPYIIETANEFSAVVGNNAGNEGIYFQLGNDITLPSNYETISEFNGILDGYGYEINGLNKPLFGMVESVQVDLGDGEFETVGGSIKNLTVSGEVNISADTTYYGLLAVTLNGASVENVAAFGSIAVTADTCRGIGGLAGEASWSTIENAFANVAVYTENCDQVGGLLGYSAVSKVNQTGALGSVSGNNSVGGLIGYAVCGDNDSGVRKSFATGEAAGNNYVGGLIGQAAGSECAGIVVEDTYARGVVIGNEFVGGLIGGFYGDTLERSYATGSVSGQVSETTGGLVGEKSEWSSGIFHSFWNSDLSGVLVSAGGENAITSELDLKDEYTYTLYFEDGGDWDFQTVWSIDQNENDGYPCFQWSYESCAFSYDGGSGWDGSGVAMYGHVRDSVTNDPIPNAEINLSCGEGSGVVIQADGTGAYTFTKSQIYTVIDAECAFAGGIGLYATADGYNRGDEEWSEDRGDEEWEEWIDNYFTGALFDFHLEGDGENNNDLDFTNPTTKTVQVGSTVNITDLAIIGDGDENEVFNINLYVNGGSLSFGNDTGLTFNGADSGQNLQFSGTRAAINAALQTLMFTATTEVGTYKVEALINGEDGDVVWFTNGHAYRVVTVGGGGISWNNAKTAAETQRFGGVYGYLATITSLEEHEFILTRINQDGWIGASDSVVEGAWRWVTGPEGLEEAGAGRLFWSGNGDTGSVVTYANWNRTSVSNKEPNNASSNEHCAQVRFSVEPKGQWNDLPCGNLLPNYVVEFGGINDELPEVVNTDFDIIVTELEELVVSNFNPANGATGVSRNISTLSFTFSEPMTLDSATAYLKRYDNDTEVQEFSNEDGSVTISENGLVVTFHIEGRLQSNTRYYIEIDSDFAYVTANHSQIFGDEFGNTFWSFTTTRTSGGGSSSGSGRSGGSAVPTPTQTPNTNNPTGPTDSPTAPIAPVAPSCSLAIYPTQPIRIGAKNDPAQVRLLEEFLNQFEKANLPVDGVYSAEDEAVVKAWQEKYASEILTPWGTNKGTGYVFRTSLDKIKRIFSEQCSGAGLTSTLPIISQVRDLYVGMRGEDVKALQTILINQAYSIPAGPTGIFAAQTQSALAKYQSQNKISPAVGYFGAVTRTVMKSLGVSGLWW